MVRSRDSARPEELEGGRDARDKDARKIRAKGKLVLLTPYLRRRLKRPVGRLYAPEELGTQGFLKALRASPFVITVGDRVTDTMHELGRTPDLQIVDGVERRKRRAAPDASFAALMRAKNPPGTITWESVAAIRRALSGSKPARVLVEGEEDLLVIPAILAAPMGATVYYGQPGEGVVLVHVDERTKASAERILAAMKSE